jgi:hypothetical protein
VVRLALGAAFLRAARFSFFRSSLSSILVVFATCNLFRCNLFNVSGGAGDAILMVTAIEGSEQGTVGRGQGLGTREQGTGRLSSGDGSLSGWWRLEA